MSHKNLSKETSLKTHNLVASLATFLIFSHTAFQSNGQILTAEDSLNAGLSSKGLTTYLSGYGEAVVSYDMKLKTGIVSIRRNVLFIGHKFSDNISFFSELELEDAAVAESGGIGGHGKLSLEQLYLKFNFNPSNYIVTGLFIPRIGIINENHLPTTFNGNDRHQVEQQIIPATWREIGIGFYSTIERVPGLNLSCALLNGLSSKGFTNGTGIAGGKFGGSEATASNLAVTAAALYYCKNWRTQASYYYGGSAGLSKRVADSLQLSYGIFGTPVQVIEANVQYLTQGLTAKALVAEVFIPNAGSINRAYASNTPSQMVGALAEIGYNVFYPIEKLKDKSLTVFARYEYLNLNEQIPDNGIKNDALNKQYITAGLTYIPVAGVAVKVDYTHRITGEQNPALWVNPFPQPLPYYASNGFVNLGVAYSF